MSSSALCMGGPNFIQPMRGKCGRSFCQPSTDAISNVTSQFAHAFAVCWLDLLLF